MQAENDIKDVEYAFAHLDASVKLRGHLCLFDINKVSENVFRDLFNDSFGWKLANLNFDEKNIDSIDLGDDQNKIAIQVTSTVTSDKIKKTVEGFEKNSRFQRFSRLIIFFLRVCDRLPKCPKISGSYTLECWDLKRLLSELNNLHVDSLANIAKLIKSRLLSPITSNNSFEFIEKFSVNAAEHIKRVATIIARNEMGGETEFRLKVKAIKTKFQQMKCSEDYRQRFNQHAVFFPTIISLRDSDSFEGGGAIVNAIASLIGNVYTAVHNGCANGDEVHRVVHGHIVRRDATAEEVFSTEIFISFVVHDCGIFNDEK